MSLLESRVVKPDKTVNRSFRISEKAYKALEEGAAKGKISLNTFVNQLFLNYAEFDRYASKVHPLDRNWSLFSAIFMKTVMEPLGSGPINHLVSDESVMLDLPN